MQTARQHNTHSPGPDVSARAEPKTRDDLLWLATIRFCGADDHNRLTTKQYTEAFYLLIGQVTQVTQKIIANSLAGCNSTPRVMALYLAMESIDIAAPILTHSFALGQLDLLQIVDAKGADHAAEIARRPDLGPSLVKRLMRVGSPAVAEALDANPALLDGSHTRSAKALFQEIGRRRAADELAENEKDEQSQTAATETRPSDFNVAENALLTAAARGGRTKQAETTTPPTPLPIPDFGNAFERAARAHSRQGMAVLMQKQSGITLETCHRVLEDKTGDTLAVFLRAAEVDDAQANRIQMLAQPTIGLSVQNAMRAVRFYAGLNSETCLAAVEKWPRAKTSIFEHQPQLAEGRDTVRTTPRQVETSVRKIEWASDAQSRKAS